MTGNPARQARIASQIQRSLVTLLRRGVKDPRVGNVTVTAVTLASDLSSATVYVLPFADRGTEAPAMLAGLDSAAGYLRGQLSRELKLRHMPRLQFCLDEQLERAHQLTSLIDHAVADDATRAQEQQEEGQEPVTRRPSEE
ncbi:MAG TPA: 30S ribosome-binding factor RbfA [Steroidobacteraceae bacterium]|jgi:ribosome-binding factor A|nr:30S ribosome-binding factor RbfA [Steroidobacteraceae bacterium]